MTNHFVAVSGEYTAEIDLSEDRRVQTFRLEHMMEALTFQDVLNLWQRDAGFTGFFVSLLTSSGLKGYVWETPPVTRETASQPFEFTLTQAGPFHAAPDYSDFRDHLQPFEDREFVAVFDNLGHDAQLIVPSVMTGKDFRDLQHFLANASKSHISLLWETVGETMLNKLNDAPIWLSVAGDGVAWLHVRLDTAPKYTRFAPYRRVER